MTANFEAVQEKKPLYLIDRNGIYGFKRKVPTAARNAFGGRAQIWKSLETMDFDTAVLRLKDEVDAFERTLANALEGKTDHEIAVERARNRKPGTTKYLQAGHIPQIIEGYVFGVLSTDDEERKGTSKDERAERVAMLEDGLEQMLDDSAAENLVPWEEVLEHQLEAQALIAPPGSELRHTLLQRLVKADIDLMRIQIERLKGYRHETPLPPSMARYLLTMQELYDLWVVGQTNEKTKETYRTFVAEFEALVGAQPVVSITTHHVLDYRSHLVERGLKRSSGENHIGALATIFRYAKHKSKRPELKYLVNPFEQIDTSEFIETEAHETRRPFHDSELIKLFDSKLYTKKYVPTGQAKEALFWTPLLGLFAGMRLNEIAQLHTRDIKKILGVMCIEITDTEEANSIKTRSSKRRIPIHDELIRFGFLAYVENRLSEGGGRLFPSLRNDNKYKNWSNALGKVHGRYLDDIGIDDMRVDHHSYRYNFKQQCTTCGISDEVRDALTGHWLDKKLAGRRYMRGGDGFYPIAPLAEAMKKLRFPSLNLEHLYSSL